VYFKKVFFKDVKTKTRENKHLKLFNVYVVLERDYRKIIFYLVDNEVGKMITKVYTE
jgi:hypothetical protein